MSPAAHAAVGAALGGRLPWLGIALPLAFASHFVLDAIPHFELFFPLAHWLGVSHEAAFWIVAFVCGALITPALLWVTWRRRNGVLLVAYCVVLTAFLIGYQTPGVSRLVGAVAITFGFGLIERSAEFMRWLACAFATVLPDVARGYSAPLDALHHWAHYTSSAELGHHFYAWFDGGPGLFVTRRFDNWAYVAGYSVELLFELAVFVGAIYLAVRRPRTAEPAPRAIPDGDTAQQQI